MGKYLSYALLAVALDLVWGYAGILSLGHGAFFALGGYAMGMHLMREIGDRGVYANPVLPDFMVFLSYEKLPWFWHGFDMFWFAALMVLVVPGLARLRLRLVRLPQPRHRRLPLDHHPGADLRADAGLLPQRDGLRRQQRPHRLPRRARLRPQPPTPPGSRSSSCRGLALAGGLVSGARSPPRNSARCWWRCATPRAGRASSATGSSTTSSSSSWSRRCWPASPARSTCRRSASSIPANSPRPTPSRS